MKNILFCLVITFLCFSKIKACTVIYYSNDTCAIAGNNEDFITPYSQMKFYPPEDGKYGCVFFGFKKIDKMNFGEEQGGMNDQGLFYDGLATPMNPVLNSKDKPTFYGNVMKMVLEKCATVEQALEMLDKYNLGMLMTGQIMIGDASGNAAIIEGDVIIRKEREYQICTNFYQSQVKDQNYPCNRYITANSMLDSAKSVNVKFMSKILSATHNEGEGSTLYSNVYDLKRKIIYIYHFHDFDNVIEIDLDEELKNGKHAYQLADIFPKNPKYMAYKDEQLKKFKGLELDHAKLLKKFQTELLETGKTDITSVSANEILNGYFKSIGGRALVDEVKSLTITGKIAVPLGGPLQLDGLLKSYQSDESKMYQYIEIKGFDISEKGVNGMNCWKKSSHTDSRLLEGDEKYCLLLESSFDTNKPELYSKIKYMGIMDIQGTQCHKLLLTTKEGFSVAKYFDINTNLLKASMKIVKTENTGPEKTFTLYDIYKNVHGILFPHRVSESVTKQDLFAIRTDYYTIELEYEINAKIPEEYYNIPKKLQSKKD